jgi:hypothetical protein
MRIAVAALTSQLLPAGSFSRSSTSGNDTGGSNNGDSDKNGGPTATPARLIAQA